MTASHSGSGTRSITLRGNGKSSVPIISKEESAVSGGPGDWTTRSWLGSSREQA